MFFAVREYILGELKELGLEPEMFTYEGVPDKYKDLQTINNIYAKIDGKNGEEVGLLGSKMERNNKFSLYENVNDRSIQHYGEQALPVVKEFVYSDKYLVGSSALVLLLTIFAVSLLIPLEMNICKNK
ncbi:hypothetical protein [Clostridium sp.]|uniref:hypothetical protein n=1 Tax=Clostridium sp. TaxID=1506 RepID=UPI003217B363